MTKRVAIYARCATLEQTTTNQIRELEAAALRHGWQVVAIFDDDGVSGVTMREQRPAMKRLLRAVARREVDLVAAWSVDRLGRSLLDLIGFLGELHGKGVDLYLHQQGLDTSTPAGKAMFGMLGVFAEFERSMFHERVAAGIARARASGTRSGRAIGRPRVDAKVAAQAKHLLAEGVSGRAVAKATGLAEATVRRLKHA